MQQYQNNVSARDSAQEELDPVYGQPYVAYNKKTGKLMCNQSIYNEEDVSQILMNADGQSGSDIIFLSFMAAELKDMFDSKFDLYKTQLSKMNEIAPQAISGTLETTVSKFFSQIEMSMRQVEQQVLSKIDQSKNLNDLQNVLTQLKPGFGVDQDKIYESSKQKLENCIKTGNFTQVVQQKDTYEALIKNMKQNNQQMSLALDEGQKRIRNIMVVNFDDNVIGKRINQIVDSCLEIDIRGMENTLKRQRSDDAVNSPGSQQHMYQAQQQQQQQQQRLQFQQQQQQEQQQKMQQAKLVSDQQKAQEDQRARVIEQMRQQQLAQQAQKQQQERAAQEAEAQRKAQEEQRQAQEQQAIFQKQREEEMHRQKQEAIQKQFQEAQQMQKLREEQQRQYQEQLRIQQQKAKEEAEARAKAIQEEQERIEARKQAEIQRQKQEAEEAFMRKQREAQLQQQLEERKRAEELAKQQAEEQQMKEQVAQMERMQANAAQELFNQNNIQQQSTPVVPQPNMPANNQSFLQFQNAQVQQQEVVASPVDRILSGGHMMDKCDQEDDDMMHSHMMDEDGGKDVIISSHQEVPQVQQSNPMPVAQNIDQAKIVPNITPFMTSNQTFEQAVHNPFVQQVSTRAANFFNDMNQQAAKPISPVQQLSMPNMPEVDQIERQAVPELPEEPQTMTDESGNNEANQNGMNLQQLKQPEVLGGAQLTQTIDTTACQSDTSNNQDFSIQQHQMFNMQDANDQNQFQQAISGQQQQLPEVIPAPQEPVQKPFVPHMDQDKFGLKAYKVFYNMKSNVVYTSHPKVDKSFDRFEECTTTPSETHPFLSRCISLPDDRVFVIGGSSDMNCSSTTKETFEVVKQPNGARPRLSTMAVRANMYQSRAAFGIAVYPNFSQIFVAGGQINNKEATKHCERYIVEQKIWKRLPELKEAKFSVSLCFFNNGSTLFCFGGLQKINDTMQPTSTIERLSKGQNSWQILSLRLPQEMFDVGCIQVNQTELLIFGGFNGGALDTVYTYTNTDPKTEGTIDNAQNPQRLDKPDFFVTNGNYIEIPSEYTAEKEKVFQGHSNIYILNTDTKVMKSTPIV